MRSFRQFLVERGAANAFKSDYKPMTQTSILAPEDPEAQAMVQDKPIQGYSSFGQMLSQMKKPERAVLNLLQKTYLFAKNVEHDKIGKYDQYYSPHLWMCPGHKAKDQQGNKLYPCGYFNSVKDKQCMGWKCPNCNRTITGPRDIDRDTEEVQCLNQQCRATYSVKDLKKLKTCGHEQTQQRKMVVEDGKIKNIHKESFITIAAISGYQLTTSEIMKLEQLGIVANDPDREIGREYYEMDVEKLKEVMRQEMGEQYFLQFTTGVVDTIMNLATTRGPKSKGIANAALAS